jgi:hypothetical protein
LKFEKIRTGQILCSLHRKKNEIEGSLIFQKPKTKDNEEIK